MFFTSRATHHTPLATRGLTLVEMLISMAVTLVMMAAVVNLFANIGSGVRNRRASMELGGELRMARARLFKDLAGATSAARPVLPGENRADGYLEIIEGQYSDEFSSGLLDGDTTNGELEFDTSLVPRNNHVLDYDDDGEVTDTDHSEHFRRFESLSPGGLGDYDDILALTVRSEDEPFVGRLAVWQDPDGDGNFDWIVTTIESNLAEIIWFAVENPADGSLGEPGMRTVYRRVLLIAPWVGELPPSNNAVPPEKAIPLDQIYHQLSDVSFRKEGDLRVPNTLADLTKRENRFGHFREIYPHALELKPIRNDPETDRNNFPEFFAGGRRPVMQPFGLPFEWDQSDGFDPEMEIPTLSPGEVGRGDDRKGEDVMLNDVLAFDLRVYDPGAPLFEAVANVGPVVEPSDAGWGAAPPANLVGEGAYVDLFWNHINPLWQNANIPKLWTSTTQTLFANAPNGKSGLNFSNADIASVTYDTWPFHYENDGLDQDVGNDNGAGIDQGTDRLDTDNQNGVDDANERETAPPYAAPLRGIQVKIRTYDRESRQIREATVTRNFVPQ